jgi:hypothetical protein
VLPGGVDDALDVLLQQVAVAGQLVRDFLNTPLIIGSA